MKLFSPDPQRGAEPRLFFSQSHGLVVGPLGVWGWWGGLWVADFRGIDIVFVKIPSVSRSYASFFG